MCLQTLGHCRSRKTCNTEHIKYREYESQYKRPLEARWKRKRLNWTKHVKTEVEIFLYLNLLNRKTVVLKTGRSGKNIPDTDLVWPKYLSQLGPCGDKAPCLSLAVIHWLRWIHESETLPYITRSTLSCALCEPRKVTHGRLLCDRAFSFWTLRRGLRAKLTLMKYFPCWP